MGSSGGRARAGTGALTGEAPDPVVRMLECGALWLFGVGHAAAAGLGSGVLGDQEGEGFLGGALAGSGGGSMGRRGWLGAGVCGGWLDRIPPCRSDTERTAVG